ncbi:entericidin A/B family lipoprotein [Sphingosinithalassobacter portus]|nr:entericidin A/B family lipoprotein [Sphingosinithalassobacter portus]
MRKFLCIAAIAGMFAVSACNTVEGMGEDVSSAGDAVSGAADGAK